MCSHIIFVVYIYRILYCLNGLALFYHISHKKECMCRWKFIKNEQTKTDTFNYFETIVKSCRFMNLKST